MHHASPVGKPRSVLRSTFRSSLPGRLGGALLAAALLLLPAPAPGQQPAAAPSGLTAHDVARLRLVTTAVVSPDGGQVAYLLDVPRDLETQEDGAAWSELHLVDADGRSRPFVTGEVDVSDPAWLPDGSALSFLAKRGEDETTALYRIAADGGEAVRLLGHGDGIDEYAWSPDGRWLAFLAEPAESEEAKALGEKGFQQIVVDEEWRPVELWLSEVTGEGAGEPRKVALAGSASELSWSPAGDRLAVAVAPTSLIDDHYMLRRIHVVDPAGGEVTGRIDNPGKLGAVRWSPDGARLALVAGATANDPAAARLMTAPATGGVPSELLAGFEGDAVDVAWLDAETLLWIAAEGVERTVRRQRLGGGPETVVAAGAIWGSLSVAAGGPDGTATVALVAETPEHPGEVFVWRGAGEPPARLTDSNPWLAERRLAPQEVVRYRARDGLELEGLLMRPLGVDEGQRAPLVLIVHGGPEAHVANGWLTVYSRPGQVLAAKGYAVFYPNYRGSTGRGLEFALRSQADPAGPEFDDLIDGVDHLIAAGVADGERVGVTGGSYGGYATAWCSTRYSERFAAGVMFVGISDKVSKLGTSDIPNELYLVHARHWPWEDWQRMLERSPISYLEQARTPLLILGGDADPRVHPSQSLVLFRYLKLLGNTPVRYVVYPGEKHGNRKAAARLDYTLRALRWFDHYLAGPSGAPPPHELDYGLDAAAD